MRGLCEAVGSCHRKCYSNAHLSFTCNSVSLSETSQALAAALAVARPRPLSAPRPLPPPRPLALLEGAGPAGRASALSVSNALSESFSTSPSSAAFFLLLLPFFRLPSPSESCAGSPISPPVPGPSAWQRKPRTFGHSEVDHGSKKAWVMGVRGRIKAPGHAGSWAGPHLVLSPNAETLNYPKPQTPKSYTTNTKP